MTKNKSFSFGKENLDIIKIGVFLYNDEKFWECHEELEHHWLEARGDNIRYIYWAIIQAAACLYHVRQENLVGAQGLHKKTLNKLIKCEDLFVESKLLEESINWIKFKQVVRNVRNNPGLLDFKELYGFKFNIPTTWSKHE